MTFSASLRTRQPLLWKKISHLRRPWGSEAKASVEGARMADSSFLKWEEITNRVRAVLLMGAEST